MFRKQFRERGDGDIKLVLSILRYEHFGFFLRESLGLPEGGDGGFVGTRIGQRTERNRVRVYNDVSILLILECPGGNVGWILLDQGNNFTLSPVWCRYNPNAICSLWCARLEKISKYQRYVGSCAYIRGGDPSPNSRTPSRYKKTESMPGSERNTGKKSPLFAPEPVIILDVVGVRKQGIQGEKGEGI